MRHSIPLGGRRDPEGYRPWLLGIELLLACLSGLRLRSGWHGDFEEWLAAVVIVGCTAAAVRELHRLI